MNTHKTPDDFLRAINYERGKWFLVVIGSICLILFVAIVPLIFDLSLQENKLLRYSHLLIVIISLVALLLLYKFEGGKKSNIVLYIYLFMLTAIETVVCGILDTISDRGPTLYLVTIIIIGFLFFYNNWLSIFWISLNYMLFVFLVIIHHQTSQQLVSSLGNGTVFTLIVLGMKFFLYQQKTKEYQKQMIVIDYILKSEKKKSKPKKDAPSIPISDLHEKFIDYVIVQKQYLNKELTLSQVADEIGTNTTYLSQCINQQYGKNFNALINDFRVDEAIRIMGHKLSSAITIEAVSEESGFKSKSAFYVAFKNKTGQTPTEYFSKGLVQ